MPKIMAGLPLHFQILPLLLICFTAHGLKTIETGIRNCPSFDCGDGVIIRYPFWVSPAVPDPTSFCGYPDFNISCKGSTPSFRTPTDSYTVKSVDTKNRILSLVDSDVIGLPCPRARHNVSLGNLNKSYGVDYADPVEYLVFFFNCTLDPHGGPIGDDLSNISCLWDVSGGDSFVFLAEDSYEIEKHKNLSRFCPGGIIVSPVQNGSVSDTDVATAFVRAMNGGFNLTWKQSPMENCRICEKRGGRCGYHNRSGNGLVFRCICNDGSHCNSDSGGLDTSTGKGSKRLGLKIGLAVGVTVGIIFFMVACLAFFLYRRHKNKRSYSFTSFFRKSSTASDPSSIMRDPTSLSGSYYKTPIFSYEELDKATGGFDEANELGNGGFGVVFKGKLKDGRIVAVKRLYERNHRRVKQFRNEVEILNRLRHRNLVSFYGCTSARDSPDLVLVYEYIPNGTVADHLHGSRAAEHALTWSLRLVVAIETADALTYLHAHHPQIIHRDVKTSNILLDDNFSVKVADFGLSRLFPLDVTHVSTAPQGTPGYVDPEYHQCYQLTDKSDVYSFGVVLVELISSMPAVDISRNRSEINLSNMAVDKIPKGLVGEMVDPMLGFSEDAAVRAAVERVAEVAFMCLQGEKDMRPTMEEVREMLKDVAAGGDGRSARAREKDMGDEAYLLKPSALSQSFSPKSVADRWASVSTTPGASA